ncbi:hypothetical protein ACH4VR_36130 [Streptomyces sp. NPDC020883]|uniref:hypothetical protein n=1 Tax=Streptomyces sp. NPDC020883 TaxID=3365099 RepID=UPI003797D8E6
MPHFPEAAIAAAREREEARQATLRRNVAKEIRDWIAGQGGIDQTWLIQDKPGTVAVELTDGTMFHITVTTDDD